MYRIPGQYSSRRSKPWKAKKTERGSEIRVDWGDVTTKHSVIPWVRKYKRDRKRLPMEKLAKFKLSLEFS